MVFFFLPPINFQHLHVYWDLRERYEARNNRDFTSSKNDNRDDLYSRWRVGATFDLSKEWKGQLEWQYSHDEMWTPARNFSTWNSDASLAFVETKQQGLTYTIGRQKIAEGQQRLIGPSDWLNVPRSFDGVRARTANWDFWATNISVALPKPRDARIFGLTNKNGLGDTSLFYKSDKVPAGDVRIYTLDQLYTRKHGSWACDFEGALQGGRNAGKDQEAWALHGRAVFTVNPKTSAYLEGNVASGGGTSDKVRTFDQLYPTNHDKYGLMDMQGWRNMRELALGLDFKTTKTLVVRAGYHHFWLQDTKDAWYAAGGAPNARPGGIFKDPTGKSGRDIGQEVDLEGEWTFNKTATARFGLASLDPGHFVKKLSSGDKQTWAFAQVTFKF